MKTKDIKVGETYAYSRSKERSALDAVKVEVVAVRRDWRGSTETISVKNIDPRYSPESSERFVSWGIPRYEEHRWVRPQTVLRPWLEHEPLAVAAAEAQEERRKARLAMHAARDEATKMIQSRGFEAKVTTDRYDKGLSVTFTGEDFAKVMNMIRQLPLEWDGGDLDPVE